MNRQASGDRTSLRTTAWHRRVAFGLAAALLAGCGGGGGGGTGSADVTAAAVPVVNARTSLQGVPAQALAWKAGSFAYREPDVDASFGPIWKDIGVIGVSAEADLWRIRYQPRPDLAPTACASFVNGCPGAYRSYDLLADRQRNLLRDLDGCTYRRDGSPASLPTLPDVAQDGYRTALQVGGITRICGGQEQAVRAVFRGAEPIDGARIGGEAGQWEHLFVVDLLDAATGARLLQLGSGLNVMPVTSKIAVFSLTQTDYGSGGSGTTGKRLVMHVPLD